MNNSFKNQHFDRVWSSFETFFDNFEKGFLPEIKKTDVYFYTLKAVTQTQFEACVNAYFISRRTLPQTLWRSNIIWINSTASY